MCQIKRKPHRLFVLLVLFATFCLLLNGLALASGEGAHGGSQESVDQSSPEGVHEGTDEGAHGKDRKGDLLDLRNRFINFALLIIILFVAIRKSGLKDSLTGRIKDIQQKLEDLRTEKEEAEGKYQDIDRKLRDFEAKRKEILEQSQKEGQAEKERIIAEAKERAKQIVGQAELTIRQEMQSAKDRLRREVVELAAQKAKETITKEMTDEDQDRLVNGFIEKVGEIH